MKPLTANEQEIMATLC